MATHTMRNEAHTPAATSAVSRVELTTASSAGVAIGDDALKDMHVAGFLYDLERREGDRWIERIGWIRLVDRMAEADLLEPGSARLPAFIAGWSRLRETGVVIRGHASTALLEAIQEALFGIRGRPRDPLAIRAFDSYVEATRRYHERGITIEGLAEFERMLGDLSGSILLCMPHAPVELEAEVIALGALDQLYNEVRDLLEDGACGLCRFPSEVLDRFSLRPTDFFTGRFDAPGIPPLLAYLVSDLGPRMRERYASLRSGHTIPPTWRVLVDEFDQRHDLVQQTMIESGFDVRAFTASYWEKARTVVRA